VHTNSIPITFTKSNNRSINSDCHYQCQQQSGNSRNDGGFTVQNYEGAVTTTPNCPPQSATVMLGPSIIQNGGARILASFEPCILTDGSVVLNLPDEQGIQLVAANIQAAQTNTISSGSYAENSSYSSRPNPLYGRFEWTDYRTRPCDRKSCDFKW
ncbi:MAG: hypothetical protein ACR2IS_20245, partial [Nitrososphaeraceae archaeon]